MLTDAFLCGSCAWDGESSVGESGIFDVGSPGDLVADVVGILIGEEFGEVDWCWGWSGGVACWDCEAFGFGAIGVAGGVD